MAEGTRFSPAMLGEENLPPPTDRAAVLLDGFKTLRFQYMMNDGVDTEWRPDWNGHDEEALPAAVRIMVEGMAGLEIPVWGQEIPIMVAMYGENLGEVDEEDLAEQLEDEEAANAAQAGNGQDDDDDNGRAGGGRDDDDDDDNEAPDPE